MFNSYAQITYNANGNNGFGGAVGEGSLSINDDGTTVTFTLTKGTNGDFNDTMVMYIDNGLGGRNLIDGDINDNADSNRRAISNVGSGDLIFPTGFEASHAVAINVNFGGLWSIPATGAVGTLPFVVATGAPTAATDASFVFSFEWADIGLTSSDHFHFVITYGNPNDSGDTIMCSSDEAFGGSVTTGNPCSNSFSFTTYFDYPTGNIGGRATTAQNGNWSDASTWTNGNVPFPEDDVVINHDVTLNQDATVSSLEIGTLGSLISEDTQARTLTIRDAGSFILNGAFNANDGNIIFDGSGTISGINPRIFNNVELNNGGVDFGTTPTSTINGTLRINSGGFVFNNSPVYGNSSTLIYNINNTYGRRSEWSNAGVQGVPHNVVVQNGTTLQMGFDASRVGIDAEITGQLTIQNGSSLDMEVINQMQADLIVGGDLQNNGTINASNFSTTESSDIIVQGSFSNGNTGTVTLSTTSGNDLIVQGNYTDNGGIFFNNRAIFFSGNQANQNVQAGADPYNIPYMVIDKPQGKVILNQNLTLSGDLGGDVLDMRKGDPSDPDTGLELNGHTLQIGDGTDSKIRMDSLSATSYTKLIGDENSKIAFNSTNSDSDNILRFSQNATDQENYLSEFEMQGTGSVSISDTLNIANRFILNDGTFNSDGHLTFKSSETLTAVLPEVISGTISGEVRVERHFPQNNRAYRYISSSVTTSSSIHANWQEGASDAMTADPYTDPDFNPNPGFGTHITGEAGTIGNQNTNGLDFTPSGNPSLFSFDESDQGDPWKKVLETKNTTLQAGDAYALLVRGDRSTTLNSNTAVGPATTLRTTGTLAIGDQPAINPSMNSGEFALVGNPYQAQVDMREILDGVNSTDFNTDYMWIWDPTIGTLGGYAVVELNTNPITNIPTDFLNPSLPATSNANQYLQPFQACILRANGNSPSLNFVESAKRDDADQSNNIGTFSDDMASANALEIELYRATTQTLFDAVRLRFDSNYTTPPGFEDATKLWNSTEQLAIINANSYLSIDKRDFPQANDTIPLYTGNYLSNQYSLKLDYSPDEGQTAKLYDHYLDQALALQDGLNTYDFNVDPNIPESVATDRFGLVFNEETLSSTQVSDTNAFVIYPNPAEDFVFIEVNPNTGTEDVQVECYDVLGKIQFNSTLSPDEDRLSLDVSQLSSGYYILKISSASGTFNHKFVKQ